MVFFIIGVSGVGKSSIGQAAAREAKLTFIEGDEYHAKASVDKMAQGIPLQDGDRWAWLERLNTVARAHLSDGNSVVVSCSALKERYRDVLRTGLEGHCAFIVLDGSPQVIAERMAARDHFFSGEQMLKNQLDNFERPHDGDATFIDVDQPFDAVLARCAAAIVANI